MTKVKLHCLIQVSRSIDEFVFHFMTMRPCLPEIKQIQYLTLKIKVKVIFKVKIVGPIVGVAFNQNICFLFHGNRTIRLRDKANLIRKRKEYVYGKWK